MSLRRDSFFVLKKLGPVLLKYKQYRSRKIYKLLFLL